MTSIEINGTKISQHIDFLVTNTSNVDRLAHTLVQYGIFNVNEHHRIQSEWNYFDRAGQLYFLLLKKVTDSVFTQLIELLRNNGNFYAADKLEYVTDIHGVHQLPRGPAISRYYPEFAASPKEIHFNLSLFILTSMNNDYKRIKYLTGIDAAIISKITLKFLSFRCKDIVPGLQGCDGLRTLLLDGVEMCENECLIPIPELNDSDDFYKVRYHDLYDSDDSNSKTIVPDELNYSGNFSYHRVQLPSLKEFVWTLYRSRDKDFEPTQSYIDSWIFFYKTEDNKSWYIKDIGFLEMEIFKIHYSHTSQCILEINSSERSFRCRLEDNVDSALKSFQYSLVILELWNCRVTLKTLPLDRALKEWILRDVVFEDEEVMQMDDRFLYKCDNLVSLQVSSILGSLINVYLYFLPAELEVLKLFYVGVVATKWFTCFSLKELMFRRVWFIHQQYNTLWSGDLYLNLLKELETLNIDTLQNNPAIVNLQTLHENITSLTLCRINILKCSDMYNFRFADQLVELELKGVGFVLGGRREDTAYLRWINQFKNLKKLTVASTRHNEIAVHLHSLPSGLTNLVLYDIQLLLLFGDPMVPPFKGVKFGDQLKELEFIHCEFIIQRNKLVPTIPHWFHRCCKTDFKNWMKRLCPHMHRQYDSGGWLRYSSTPSVENSKKKLGYPPRIL